MTKGKPGRTGYHKNGKRADTVYRLRRAMELRRKGKSYQDIVDAGLFKSRGSAAVAVNKELERVAQETRASTEIILQQELDRLDALMQSLWPQATMELEPPGADSGGDEPQGELDPEAIAAYQLNLDNRNKAADRLLRVIERRTKLLGLEAPQVLDHRSSDGSWTKPVIDPTKLTDDQLLAVVRAMGGEEEEKTGEQEANDGES